MNPPDIVCLKTDDFRRLLATIEASAGVRDDDLDEIYCPHCAASTPSYPGSRELLNHNPECPVLWARALGRTLLEPSGCRFIIAWVGPCGAPITDRGMCKKHAPLKCAGCEEPATQECPSASSLVCGAPICDQCQHGASGQHCRPGTEGTP